MKKRLIFAFIAVCVLVICVLPIAGCGGAPPPAAAPSPPPPPPPPPPQSPQPPQPSQPPVADTGLILDGAANYTVVRGDTLADIAARKYGGTNMYFFPLIRLANAGAVSNPDLIEVGTNLAIPNLQRNLDSPAANALIRADMLSIAAQYERQKKLRAAAALRNLATRLSR